MFYINSSVKLKNHGLQKSNKNINLLVLHCTERLQAVEQRFEPGPRQVRNKRQRRMRLTPTGIQASPGNGRLQVQQRLGLKKLEPIR